MPTCTRTRVRALQNYLKLNNEVYKDIKVSHYKSSTPIYVIDFGRNAMEYHSFTSGHNLDTVNSVIKSRLRRSLSSENLYSSKFICVIKSTVNTSIARISGLICRRVLSDPHYRFIRPSDTTYTIYECQDVEILRRFKNNKLPPCIANLSGGFYSSVVNIDAVKDKAVFDFVYPSIHNLYSIDNNLFLSIDVNKDYYLATDIACYLSSISNYLKIVESVSKENLFHVCCTTHYLRNG